MATYRVRPSKQLAVFGAVFGLAILIFGLVQMSNSGAFRYLWVAACLGIIGFNLWSAFGRKGHIQTITTDGDEPPPTRWGHEVTKD